MGTTYDKIAQRLKAFRPVIQLEKFVHELLSEGSMLEGIEFIPKNLDGTVGTRDLREMIVNARDAQGSRAFAGSVVKDRSNLPLQGSLMATDGEGFREIRRYGLTLQPYGGLRGSKFGLYFGNWMSSLDVSSLHFALKGPSAESTFGPTLPEEASPPESRCSIHIDAVGITQENNDNVFITLDALQHTADELLWKSILKIKHVSLTYPNSTNGYLRGGPSLGEIQSATRRVPLLGKALGAVRLPGPLKRLPLFPGIRVNVVLSDKLQLEANINTGLFDRDFTATAGLQGSF